MVKNGDPEYGGVVFPGFFHFSTSQAFGMSRPCGGAAVPGLHANQVAGEDPRGLLARWAL